MSEHPGDHLIEIGDPTDDSAPGPVAGPHVVIEYRDRGLPWMLVLPLMVTAAALAIMGSKAFDRQDRPSPEGPAVLVAESTRPQPMPTVLPDRPVPATAEPALPPPSPVALPPEKLPPLVGVETETPPAVPTTPAPAEPIPADPVVAAAAPEVPAVAEVAAPAPTPPPLASASVFGFDLEALEKAEVKSPEAEPAREAEPRPAAPEVAELPKAIDPGVLPRDPRQAEIERYQRFLAERQRRDDERVRFHADLRAVLRRFGKDGGAHIADLCRRYGFEPDPVAKAQAKASRVLSLGAAGLDQKVRINMLRSIGWPEAGILLDLTSHQGKWEDGSSRNGPRSYHEILSRCAGVLLTCPPRSAAASTVRASGTTSAPPGRR